MTHHAIVKETLLKAFIPVAIFLVAQAGYLISWMSRIETTLNYVEANIGATQDRIDLAIGNRYTADDAEKDERNNQEKFGRVDKNFEAVKAKFLDHATFLKELDQRLRKLELQK